MSDAKKILADIEGVLESRMGHTRDEFPHPAAALDALLSHESAARTIPRHGRHWFSDEDRERLRARSASRHLAHGAIDGGGAFIAQALAHIERCQSGEEFTRLMTEIILQAADQIAALHKTAMDALLLQPRPMFWPMPAHAAPHDTPPPPAADNPPPGGIDVR